ncbi:alpha-mannosidase [Yoonia litorea]|uniref:Alpha-mannosidase n=2 Tax=Yoonia litorea TaxID=1123755 RepID=A0A1I6N0C0_9RHOB|nr:alpha-mannosidase [Yoonia litorea]
MGGRWPFTAEKIASRLTLIAPHIFRRKLPLPAFRILPLPAAQIDAPICADPTGWEEIPHYTYWGGADLNFVMKSSFSVPETWDRDCLALYMPLGVMGDIFNHPEALVHVDRVPIGSADRYHHTIPLDPSVADGKSHMLSLVGWTGLAGWPPDPNAKTKLFMGEPVLVEINQPLWQFHAQATSVLDAASKMPSDSDTHIGLIRALDAAFKALDTRAPLAEGLQQTIASAQAVLDKEIAAAGKPLDVTLHGIGHAHMDIAYLWPIDQIRLKNARTYSNVLRLMRDDPDFRFSHSQPQLYAMVEQDFPQIFAKIKDRVATGQWEVMGGMWVEPDLNIPGPEALVRQLMLGRAYFKDRFGDVETPVLWLPDTFGFPAQIPQLMRHAGLKYFVTNKLNWNQKNKVPWSTHLWEALDGSRVLAHILTTPRDVQYLPFPTNYKSDLSAGEVLGTATDATVPAALSELPICYGYGDGGGGPTTDLLYKARAFANLPGMPRFKMSTVRDTFAALEKHADVLSVWKGEHYMEGHRGVLTSQGWIKRANRLAERALHEAEALAAMAGHQPDLSEAWKLLCLNQFHDIVTGTSVPIVFEDARRDFEKIGALVEKAAGQAAAALAGNAPAVLNTSPCTGPRVVADYAGGLHYFASLPAYSVTPLSAAQEPVLPVSITQNDSQFVLENGYLKVTCDSHGRLTSVYDKALSCEVLPDGALGNVLQAFEDRPIAWDAWDIDPFFEDRMDEVSGDSECEIIEDHPLRVRLRVRFGWCNSRFTQTISLCADSRRIDFETEADWHEQHTLLKAAFPTGIRANSAEFDIQWGSVQRSTARETSFDQARFEVPAQKWARLCDDMRSMAVLNDCKYGCDVREDTIRLTLIKSATSPDPQADQGKHVFTYSLLPLTGNDRATLNHEAYALNTPLRIVKEAGDASDLTTPFVSIDTAQVIIETLKPAEDGDGVILRMFEATGETVQANLVFNRQIASAECVDFHEDHTANLATTGDKLCLSLKPYEITSVRIRFENGEGA